MAAPRPAGDEEDSKAKEAAIAKTAGFVVFSGIALSIIKALIPNKSQQSPDDKALIPNKSQESPDDKALIPNKSQQSLHEPKEPTAHEKISQIHEKQSRAIEIVKGDTLWGLSRKHGVSINAIKAANGLTGDKIYAGKKLIIP